MAQVFDCATVLTLDLAKKFKADGYEAVARYYPEGMWKSLTLQEATAISTAGLKIISVFETTASRALGGYEAGKDDGARAEKYAKSIGQPDGSCIYFAVDFDPTPNQISGVVAYIRGCSEATPHFTTGVYGSAQVIKAVQAAKACSHFWQTYAWSRGEVVPGIQVYQYRNDITVNGIGVDLDNSYGNEGWWSQVEEVKPAITVEDANYIINRWIGKEYDLASDSDKAKRHDLANMLRRASGQAEA